VLDDVGYGRRGADKSDLPLFLQSEKRLDDVITLNRAHGWADVKLQQVEVLGVEPTQTLFDALSNVLASEVVRKGTGRDVDKPFGVQGTPCLRGQEVLVTPMGDGVTDMRLTCPVVD